MKIIFLGSPAFAVPSLEIIHKAGYPIPAVVTVPDKPAGRGLEIRESAVKVYARENKLNVLQPVNLRDREFLEILNSYNPDLQIVVAFRMMPEALWKMPTLGTFNLHASLLPQYRGAAPINRAIMNGEKFTGVTTFFLKQEIDTGNILFREQVSIDENETAGELHDRLMVTGANLVLKTVKAIEAGTAREISQSELIEPGTKLHTAPKIFSQDCKIDWSWNDSEIHNQIRGLSPHPGAFTEITDNKNTKHILKIYRSELTSQKSDAEPGTFIKQDQTLSVACSNNLIRLLEVKLEGKKKLQAGEFIKGFHFADER
jgi:methionyl-tRNA formyltransferase